MPKFIVLNEKDNVAVALEPCKKGELAMLASGLTLRLRNDIPFAHKVCIKDLKPGEKVIKFGEIIGEAKAVIPEGDHVHIHNIRSLRKE